MKRKGFTLIEMLVVIGIIATLMGVMVASVSKFMKSAERARCQELVANTATALTALYQKEGAWPKTQLSGYDRFGVVSPWALAVIKRRGTSASESTPVPSGGTIKDHVVRYAIDLNGDGVIPGVQVGGETIDIRATAAVWCCGKDGKCEGYAKGLKKDDVFSWTIGQTREVQK